MAIIQNVSRRSFLTALGIGGGGLVIGFSLYRGSGPGLGIDASPPATFTPNVFLWIDESGLVSIIAHRSEMGQGIRTSTTMIVADELEADWARVRVVQGEGDEKKYGDQNTDGSHSIRGAFKPLREAGAAARMMLEAAAAAEWKVPVSEVHARNHQVVHAASGRALDYGALAAAASAQPVPAASTLKLKPKSAFRYIGKSLPIVDGHDIITGQAVFGIDTTLPGMKHAVIARPPVYGGKLVSVDSAEALKVPGVERVVTLETTPPPSAFRQLGGVAVIARNTWAAMQGRDKLKLTWDDGPNASYDSDAYAKALAESASKPGKVARNEGDIGAALKSAATIVKADYYAPHLAHSSIEPPAALADVTAEGCRVWACTQGPQGARNEVAQALALPPEKVTVNVTLLGGAFGRKSKPDFAVEAALLSKAVGAPVKVTWTREDEIQHAYYHTVTAQHLEGALDARGTVTGWLHRTAFPSISSTFAPNVTTPGADEMGLGVVDLPYAIPNIRCEACDAIPHVRIGWFRSVSNIPHAFAVCSFVDELAHATKQGSEGLPARTPGTGQARRAEHDREVRQLRRIARRLPDRHGTPARGDRGGRGEGRLGTHAPGASRARHRRAPKLPHLCLFRRRGGGRCRRHDLGPARGHGDGLRHLRAPRSDQVADGRRSGDGRLDRALRRDHIQEGTDRADQLRHLRDRADAGCARGRRDHHHRQRCAAGWRG